MGKGGMRYGAGRPGYKVKAEHTKRLSVTRWQREGNLRAGRAFTWTWTLDGQLTGSIGVWVLDDAVKLHYSLGSGDDRRDASQQITLERTSCNFGGTRPWFACPICLKRSGVLFLRAGRFACRRCQKIAYTSQSSDTMARTWLKQNKLEAKLGEDWARPKGMRQRTYDALLKSLWDCEERREEAFCIVAARLLGSM